MSDDVLLRGFAITHVMDCIADPTKNRIIAEFWDRVDEVFPYLNAVIPNLMFNPGANTVTFRRGGRIRGEYRTGALATVRTFAPRPRRSSETSEVFRACTGLPPPWTGAASLKVGTPCLGARVLAADTTAGVTQTSEVSETSEVLRRQRSPR